MTNDKLYNKMKSLMDSDGVFMIEWEEIKRETRCIDIKDVSINGEFERGYTLFFPMPERNQVRTLKILESVLTNIVRE